MDLSKLEQLLDDRGIGDPGIVEKLDQTVPEFREDVFSAESEDDGIVYLAGIASFYEEFDSAYELLRRMRPVLESEGSSRLRALYEEQLRVWRSRRDKSEHDMQYLRIVLGMKVDPTKN
jgi:hypothetical protein